MKTFSFFHIVGRGVFGGLLVVLVGGVVLSKKQKIFLQNRGPVLSETNNFFDFAMVSLSNTQALFSHPLQTKKPRLP